MHSFFYTWQKYSKSCKLSHRSKFFSDCIVAFLSSKTTAPKHKGNTDQLTDQTHSHILHKVVYQSVHKHQLVKSSPAIERNFCFGSVLLDLIEGTGSKRISTDQASLPALLLIIVGHLSHKPYISRLTSRPYVMPRNW